jgi:hypothetical protein
VISHDTALIVTIAGAVFTTGGFVYMVRTMKTDLNRVGKLLRSRIELEDKRRNNTNLAILATVDEQKKRSEIAELLREEI